MPSFGSINSNKLIGVTRKANVRAATTTVLPANTAAGSGIGKTLTATAVGVLTIDGIATVLDDRIIVRNEVTGSNNGIYKVTTEGTAGVAFILTRAIDFDQSHAVEAAVGADIYVEEGTRNGQQYLVLTNTGTIVLETTAFTFTRLVTASGTQTLENKRRTQRVYTATSTATLTPEIDTYDLFHLTAQAVALTIANYSTSSPTDGEQMRIRLLDNGTARAITFGTAYVAKGGVALPTTTTISKNMEMLFEYNSNLAKFNLLAKAEEA